MRSATLPAPAGTPAPLRPLRFLPAALEREHLRWGLSEINPLHPDVPYIVRRLRELEHGEPEGPGLFLSPWFWGAIAASVAFWVAVVALHWRAGT